MSVELTRLPSGLSVVTDAMPHLESASLGVWIGAGSRYENPDAHGISHLLEHMAFKGTRRRTARQIAEEIGAVGGDLNAATSTESTAYFARVLKADVPLALDVLSDILNEPAFDAEELRLMTVRLSPWAGGIPAPTLPVAARSGPLDQPGLPAGMQAKTDARTLSSGGSGINLTGKNRALVGLGSYLVNAVGDCNGCHAGPAGEYTR